MKRTTNLMTTTLAAVAWIAAVAAFSATGAALQGQIAVRTLTPQDIKDYSLTGLQRASGLSAVGLGQPAHLEALINIAIARSNILAVNWVLTNKPAGSLAALEATPLGTNVPTYRIADQSTLQVAGRTLLRPDVAGQYTIALNIVTADSGSTNLTRQITAGTYLGATTCALCHSGGAIASNTYTPWLLTAHATAFTNAIDGWSTDHFSQNCISCHVVGYDTYTNAVNGGFDDIAVSTGWTLPEHATNGNYLAMPADLRDVSNIQCESCHGAGSEHAQAAILNPALVKQTISVSLGAGSCSQCHDSLSHHYRSAEWDNSRHASMGSHTSASCGRCHTARGFINYTEGAAAVSTPYETITCSACHDPHAATNPHQLRKVSAVTLMDNRTTITNGGAGLLCMNCHISRRDATNYVEVTTGSSGFGPHHSLQGDMLAGANAVAYGKDIPSSAHREVVADACVTCHMQEAETSPAFTHAGGHTFAMKWDSGSNVVEMVEACVQCHGEVEGFNFKRQDYDGDGVVEGVQTEVQGLLDRLAFLLPPAGVPKPDIEIGSSWTRPQLRAAYNYRFVQDDGSLGIHNLSYAVGLLKASIADLTGDANGDGLPDSWQIAYFGSTTNLNAAPNACPAGDGVPNWLKYTLGLDPTVPGVVLPDGVVWANGKDVVNGGETNTVRIYTAAEVSFDTETGKTYQLQVANSLSSGWQNVGDPVQGTGAVFSYVTPTRPNAQQFFRVVHTP